MFAVFFCLMWTHLIKIKHGDLDLSPQKYVIGSVKLIILSLIIQFVIQLENLITLKNRPKNICSEIYSYFVLAKEVRRTKSYQLSWLTICLNILCSGCLENKSPHKLIIYVKICLNFRISTDHNCLFQFL